MISAKRIVAATVPLAILGFVLFSIGGKIRYGSAPEIDMLLQTTREAAEVLNTLRIKYRGAMERFEPKRYRGLPDTTLDATLLHIDYTLERTEDEIGKSSNDAETYFERLFCRETRFTDLYYRQHQLQSDENRSLQIAVVVSARDAVDASSTVWEIVLTPEKCLKKGY